jgi:dolichyl-phosphate beta-glucosyltransferase
MSKICVVIPCYNEYNRLKEDSFLDFIRSNGVDFDLLFVNDGSTDQTLQKLEAISKQNPASIFSLNLEKNGGKAEAVRQGFLYANTQSNYWAIAYFDADLATPLAELIVLKKILNENASVKMVLCSRIKRLGAFIDRKRKRHILGRVFSTFASIILKLPIYDTQCGAKIIHSSVIDEVFKEKFITNWLFDIEIIARLRNKYPEKILDIMIEYPITRWEDVSGSKLKMQHMLKVPLDLLKINSNYNK